MNEIRGSETIHFPLESTHIFSTYILSYFRQLYNSIAASIMLIHQNPAVWSDPLKFDPDRFLAENLKQIHPYIIDMLTSLI